MNRRTWTEMCPGTRRDLLITVARRTAKRRSKMIGSGYAHRVIWNRVKKSLSTTDSTLKITKLTHAAAEPQNALGTSWRKDFSCTCERRPRRLFTPLHEHWHETHVRITHASARGLRQRPD